MVSRLPRPGESDVRGVVIDQGRVGLLRDVAHRLSRRRTRAGRPAEHRLPNQPRLGLVEQVGGTGKEEAARLLSPYRADSRTDQQELLEMRVPRQAPPQVPDCPWAHIGAQQRFRVGRPVRVGIDKRDVEAAAIPEPPRPGIARIVGPHDARLAACGGVRLQGEEHRVVPAFVRHDVAGFDVPTPPPMPSTGRAASPRDRRGCPAV